MQIVYFVWGVIPLLFLFLIFQEFVRRCTKQYGKEDIKNYFNQFCYTAVALALAIIFDIYFFYDIADLVIAGEDEKQILSWLQYPFILLLMLQVSRHLAKRKNEQSTGGSKRKGTINYTS